MTHARILALDTAADPIHAAILRHRTAYDAYQVAPEGEASMVASDDYDAATDALTTTPCASRFGALALLGHLRWWLGEEAEFSAGHQPGYGIAQARVADLTLFLGSNLPPVATPYAFPSGRLPLASARLLPGVDRYSQHATLAPVNEALPGEDEPWQAVAAIRPDTAFVHGRRFIGMAGEMLAALVIIGGGAVLTGFASLL
ncbi:hypothetical protein AFCDBAGC_1829 [Methylobacterium cerastii]|uniref:Uncharacterized protein n=1 Tax=Methylobacterium cerastii TaxID=932741 RepID=A0ABQ4QFQ8_9HYPH|nr:hypothetical protein [Methylobacterium cerastii]GJD43967.1 hypothetical protein AFCDBAGC_1829 [Methylobacterium cerastii]